MLTIFVISLKKSIRRRKKITQRLHSLGLKFTFIDAVVGEDIPHAEKSRLCSRKRKEFLRFPLSNGALGCLMSHRLVWQKMQDDGIDCALVLEDDAIIATEVVDTLPLLENFKGNFDMINLHDRKGRPLIDVAQISNSHSLTTTRYNAIATVSYMINQKAAKHLLSISLPAIFEVDVLMNRWWEHGLQTLVVAPQVVCEDDTPSTIGYDEKLKQAWSDDTIFLKFKRRLNRARDSIAKRRLFAKMISMAKMRLIGSDFENRF